MVQHIRGGHAAFQTGFGESKFSEHDAPVSRWCSECGWWVPLKKHWSDHPLECPGVRGRPDPYKTSAWLRFVKWLRQTGLVRKVMDKKIDRPLCGPIPRTIYRSHKLLDSERNR